MTASLTAPYALPGKEELSQPAHQVPRYTAPEPLPAPANAVAPAVPVKTGKTEQKTAQKLEKKATKSDGTNKSNNATSG